MVKREYRGPPIDATEQFITERPGMRGTSSRDDDNGETVAGSTEDDFFSESTDILPSYLNTDDIPDNELEALKRALSTSISYTATIWEKYTESEIKKIVEKHLRPEQRERINDYHKVPSVSLDELSEVQRAAVEAFRSHPEFPDVDFDTLAENDDFSPKTAVRAIHRAYPDFRTYDDLKPSIRLAILIWAYEGLKNKPADIKRKYDAPNDRAIGDARRIYPDLIEAQQPVNGDDLQEAIENYKENHSISRTENKEPKPSSGGKKLNKNTGYSGLTSKQKRVVDAIAETPGDVATDIADRLDVDYSSVYSVVRKFPHIVKEEIEEVGAVQSPDEIHENILDKTEDLGGWNLGGSERMEELEQKIDAEEVAEMGAEPEAEIEIETEIDFDPTELFGFDVEEEVEPELDVPRHSSTRVLLRPGLVEGVKDHLIESDEYKSMTELVNAAVKKELNGGFGSPEPDAVQADVIETVIESIYGERKANAIRTLISDE